tara:strand:- start:339 stop:443 length:105 start_codon:yes stop_codon:yes gene_type:complete
LAGDGFGGGGAARFAAAGEAARGRLVDAGVSLRV